MMKSAFPLYSKRSSLRSNSGSLIRETHGRQLALIRWYEPQGKSWILIPEQAPENLFLMTSPPAPPLKGRAGGEVK